MSCPHLVEAESRPQITLSKPKPYNIFEDLEVFARFQHYRSESYAQAIHLMASQTSLRSDSRQSYASCVTTLKELSLSQSAPSSPKGIYAQEKSSTLPSTSSRVVSFPSPKKTSSLSLSSFFRKLSPRFHKSPKSKSKPWMVVEFSQKDIENNEFGAEGRASSDQSLELALQGKEQYMASLEDRRTSKGRVHFPGGSQPSLDAWVRAGKPKLFGPVQHPPQRPLSACLGRMSSVAVAQTSRSAQALPPYAHSQLHSSASGVACHSHVTLMPVIVVDRPGRVPSLLDGGGTAQVLTRLQVPGGTSSQTCPVETLARLLLSPYYSRPILAIRIPGAQGVPPMACCLPGKLRILWACISLPTIPCALAVIPNISFVGGSIASVPSLCFGELFSLP